MALPTTMTFRGTDHIEASKINDRDSYELVGEPCDLPAVQGLDVELEIDEGELYGDEEKKDVYAKIIGMKGSATFGQLDLKAHALVTGGSYSESGEVGSRQSKVTIGNTYPPYLHWRFVSRYQGGEDAGSDGLYEIIFYKAKLTSASISIQSQSYSENPYAFSGIAPKNLPAGEDERVIGIIRKLESSDE